VVFSLAELDPGFTSNDIIVADTIDGKPLFEYQGPLRIVAPHDKRGARSIRCFSGSRPSGSRNSHDESRACHVVAFWSVGLALSGLRAETPAPYVWNLPKNFPRPRCPYA
jgi:hypothetical protein